MVIEYLFVIFIIIKPTSLKVLNGYCIEHPPSSFNLPLTFQVILPIYSYSIRQEGFHTAQYFQIQHFS